jgi:glutathione peroxidase
MTINDIPVTTIDGEQTTLAPHADKVKLIVNVASRCGFTRQYEQLEQLQRTYGPRGFTVLGFPSNTFKQELEDSEAIKEFCTTTWGVSFPMFEPAEVNGEDRHPVFEELTKASDANGEAGDVKWNFEKFLVLPSGEVLRFRTQVEPDAPELVEVLEAHLPE